MLVNLAEKAGRDFMTTKKKNKLVMLHRFLSIPTMLIILISGCNNGPVDDPIPYVGFADITININLPAYQALRNNGYMYITDGGVKGIILYREDLNTYRAYERNCSYKPLEACTTVDIDASGLFLKDPCCSSTFDFRTGQPTGGPAWRPLNRYSTSVSGSVITITDALVN
jgi:nitrite reductase/ring-hydroxylating ferredoxin subunit